MSRSIPAILGALTLLAAACTPADDDDSSPLPVDDDSAADDDDSSPADDDDGSPADDDDDDSTELPDYVAASIPDFADCSGNAVKMMLGDGTVIGPFSGFFDSPTSFSNNFGQFTIRVGTADAWAQINGTRPVAVGSPITFQLPSSTAGNVVMGALVAEAALGGAPADTAGTFGMPNFNAHESVGGSATFGSSPDPNAATSGTFEGIVQEPQGPGSDQIVLLGVRGCFSATLYPTDF